MKTADLIVNTLLLSALGILIIVLISVLTSWIKTSKVSKNKKVCNNEDNVLLSSHLVHNAKIQDQFSVFSLIVFICLDTYNIPFPNVLTKRTGEREKMVNIVSIVREKLTSLGFTIKLSDKELIEKAILEFRLVLLAYYKTAEELHEITKETLLTKRDVEFLTEINKTNTGQDFRRPVKLAKYQADIAYIAQAYSDFMTSSSIYYK